jgi:hypothetical protein
VVDITNGHIVWSSWQNCEWRIDQAPPTSGEKLPSDYALQHPHWLD